MKRLLPSMLLLLVLVLVNCQALRKKPDSEEAKPEPTKPSHVGTIELINPDSHFVIIQLLGQVNLIPGTIVTSLGPDQKLAKLKVTPERKSVFLTADIVSGTPAKGDSVFTGPVEAHLSAASSLAGPLTPDLGTPSVSISPAGAGGALPAGAPAPEEFLRIDSSKPE